MRVGVLGAAEARLAGTPVDLGTRKQRALLAALALHRGRPVSPDTLVSLLWADAPPAQVTGTLQGYVAGLRRALEPDRAARAPSTVLVTQGAGYALHLPAENLDAACFDVAIGTAHQRLGATALVPAGGVPSLPPADLELLVAELDSALSLWRGTPYAELEEAPAASAERFRLEELRLVGLEDRAVAGLALGRHATVAAELEALTTSHPLRERLWGLRAVALTRSGRQADALDVLRQVRTLLADELGLEPGAELRDLQAAVLRQDPALGWTAPTAPQPVPGTVRATVRSTVPAQPPAPLPGRTVAPWPLVGRSNELAALVDLLTSAQRGEPAFAALVGEPGIGKSRLLAELAAVARSRGARVLFGRCSQDEGAPPLWPWAAVLDGLGLSLPAEARPDEGPDAPGDEATRFRSWDDIVRALQHSSHDETLLVLLDDLHWADVSSLRVLGLLLESVHDGRLLLVATWRDKPQPTGSLGAVAEQLSRRHGLRLNLVGLDTDQVSEILESVAHLRPSEGQADALRARTDGNPFFLLEYARLVEDDGDLAALLSEENPPGGVADVVSRRLERLPVHARSTLVAAAVVGRHFDLATVASASGSDEDQVLDALEVAAESGLVREDGVGRFRFAHALVRDTVYAGTSPTRRARWHARVAEALAGVPGREGEVARHWHGAGPGHEGRAWRADRAAAREALRLYAFEDAIDFLSAALVALAEDPVATAQDEYDVLVDLATADKATGDWINLRGVVHRAIAVAERLDDEEALTRVALMTSTDALWQSAHHGQVDEVMVAALRQSLDRLPTTDSELRCRTMLSLSGELYYGVAAQERDALAEEAVAMARRIGDPALLMAACQNAFVSTWRPATLTRRAELAEEALTIAERLGDDRALTYAQTVRAVAAAELGDVDRMESLAAAARARAEEQRNLYALVVLDSLQIPWLAMRGEHEGAEELMAHLEATGSRMGLAQQGDAVAGAYFATRMWRREYEEILGILRTLVDEDVLPMDASMLSLLIRVGRLDEARAFRDSHKIDLGGDTWFSLLPWALGAEVALALGDHDLAATTYELLAPHAGHMACAGSGVALGPVDTFLAMAAAATGEADLAARHADDALALCRAWRIPLAAEWLVDQRDLYSF